MKVLQGMSNLHYFSIVCAVWVVIEIKKKMNTDFVSSALYVVDLKKFRKVAAGDRLRGQYQGLSQDPNSLSNLDQVL